MLTKYNNKSLFNCPNTETNKKEKSQNIIDHNSCITQLENLYEKIKQQEKEYIFYKNKYDNLKNNYNDLENKFIKVCNQENDLYIENLNLKIKLKELENINCNYMGFGDDIETLFKQESIDIISIKKQIKRYEYELDGINNIFNKYNVKTEHDLINILNNYNINISQNSKKLLKKQNTFDINNFKKEWDNKYNCIKYKMSILKPGTILIINGKKKIFKKEEYYNDLKNKKMSFIENKYKESNIQNRNKIELLNNKINSLEKDIDNYCKKQINWARSIIDKKMSDKQIINIIDVYNKINEKEITNNSSKNSILKYNTFKDIKIKEIEYYSGLGNSFICNDINTRNDIPKEDISTLKEIIKTSGLGTGKKDEKINRFINTCKRIHKLTQKSTIENIVKSHTKTSIRDMSNDEFDNLLKLLEN